MGAIDTTYTFTATDTITSTKMNNIIDQTTFTNDAVFDTTLAVSAGKLKVNAQGITSNELAANAVKTIAIEDGAVTSAKLNSSVIFVPTGAVMPFAMNSAPAGWLIANGSAVSRTTYSALFALINTTYGAGDGSSTFNVPNLQGQFIRGLGGSAAAIGTAQTDMVGPHTHSGSYLQTSTSGSFAIFTGGGTSHKFDAIPNNSGTETRPKNYAMLYCIKI